MYYAHSRRARLFTFAALLAVFPVAWSLQFLYPGAGVSTCVLRTATGLPCAFCGLTRAFGAAVEGAWAEAFAYHSLWPLAAAVVVALALTALVDALTGTVYLKRLLHFFARKGGWLVAGVCALSLLRWVWL
jgi:hypothetical protein